jgi:hypothetical protein
VRMLRPLLLALLVTLLLSLRALWKRVSGRDEEVWADQRLWSVCRSEFVSLYLADECRSFNAVSWSWSNSLGVFCGGPTLDVHVRLAILQESSMIEHRRFLERIHGMNRTEVVD